ncbi:MAG: type II secretion system protein [Elusimicrobia bacterium]|nr:type II secretion system protein [Elusimicrobiota bacterium]
MNRHTCNRRGGFTLIELMIVVAIIGILAAIAIPKFADLVTKSKEGATKGSLGAIRSAAAVYYGTTEGVFPTGGTNPLSLNLTPTYINKIPRAELPGTGHTPNDVSTGVSSPTADGASTAVWAIGNDSSTLPLTAFFGQIWVNCTHNDSKGTSWTTY